MIENATNSIHRNLEQQVGQYEYLKPLQALHMSTPVWRKTAMVKAWHLRYVCVKVGDIYWWYRKEAEREHPP